MHRTVPTTVRRGFTLVELPTVRRGFTLVELLVAAALSVVVMYVLAEAFKAGTDTLSTLKSVAGLADQLRTAETIIRRDLKAQHLENDKGDAVLVSDPLFAALPLQSWGATTMANKGRGFFKIVHNTQLSSTTGAAYFNEGPDGNGIASARATNHWMQFTCKLSGRTAADVLAITSPPSDPQAGDPQVHPARNVTVDLANLPDFATLSATRGGLATFATKWVEVTYFLKVQPNAQMPPDVANGQPLHVLYRRARAVAPPGTSVSVANTSAFGLDTTTKAAKLVTPPSALPAGQPDYVDFSGHTRNTGAATVWKMNTADTVSDPAFRFWTDTNGTATYPIPTSFTGTSTTATNAAAFPSAPAPIPSTDASNFGSDILLTNVVSMRIQVLNLSQAYQDVQTNPASPTWPAVWDTYLTNDGPPRILGIRIELRVYDAKNKLSRQVTIAQPL